MDLKISSSGDYGSFSWEPPEEAKEVMLATRELAGSGHVAALVQSQEQAIGSFLAVMTTLWLARTDCGKIAFLVDRHLQEIRTEILAILKTRVNRRSN